MAPLQTRRPPLPPLRNIPQSDVFSIRPVTKRRHLSEPPSCERAGRRPDADFRRATGECSASRHPHSWDIFRHKCHPWFPDSGGNLKLPFTSKDVGHLIVLGDTSSCSLEFNIVMLKKYVKYKKTVKTGRRKYTYCLCTEIHLKNFKFCVKPTQPASWIN